MSTSDLRASDLDLLMSTVAEAYRDDPGEGMPWALLLGLAELIPCDLGVCYQHHDHRACRTLLMQGVEPGGGREPVCGPEEPAPDDPFWQLWWQATCSWPQRTGNLHRVVHTGDFFPTERARRADPMSEVLPEMRYDMMLSLPAPPGEARRILFFRAEDPSFTERERQLAELIRPHVQEIWLDAERRRAGVPTLSPREWEVLSLAAAGRSYGEIAGQLYVSTGTVRKHMEHVRERLGVHSVAAAAAIAMPHAPAVRSR
ncbi:helix-turn-helix transcriptional regulator [Petropleomorpha daqingensis]|uniref:DNA-binding CsgD family transcriptional regulator n=1 Tax=Petropleomorpha daqingensis TaxID=2026353 RepID=A0A853C9N5_9ACTN|nr:helix-turn-helix transcriptional regulator [Petropleomorpha daqingensis]NYJ04027.1 DNA-binding CsgD family transcriptional regulator [Petropleomorpha daqingensis]